MTELVQQLLDLSKIELNPFFRKRKNGRFMEFAILKTEIRLCLWIDHPDMWNPHRSIVSELANHPLHRVFRRQNFENGNWRVGNDLLNRVAAIQNSYIRHTIACRCDPHAQFWLH